MKSNESFFDGRGELKLTKEKVRHPLFRFIFFQLNRLIFERIIKHLKRLIVLSNFPFTKKIKITKINKYY